MAEQKLDIRALLAVALDEQPPDDLSERVMARVAAAQTVVELGRLLTQGPLMFFGSDEERAEADREQAAQSTVEPEAGDERDVD